MGEVYLLVLTLGLIHLLTNSHFLLATILT